MKKLFKKFVSMITVVCVVSVFSMNMVYAEAITTNNNTLDENSVTQMTKSLSEDNVLIDETCVDDTASFLYNTMDAITAVDANEDGTPVLNVKFGGVEGTIAIEKSNQEGTVLSVKEGTKHNVISIDDTGNLYVNGDKACMVYNDEETIELNHSVSNTTKCPYGKSSDYTKGVTSGKKVGYVNLTSGAVTLGAIAFGIVLAAFNPPLFATVAATIVSGVITYWATEKINPKYVSVKKWEYHHKTKGFNVKTGMSVVKRKIKLYPTKNYQGKAKFTKVSYRVFKY